MTPRGLIAAITGASGTIDGVRLRLLRFLADAGAGRQVPNAAQCLKI